MKSIFETSYYTCSASRRQFGPSHFRGKVWVSRNDTGEIVTINASNGDSTIMESLLLTVDSKNYEDKPRDWNSAERILFFKVIEFIEKLNSFNCLTEEEYSRNDVGRMLLEFRGVMSDYESYLHRSVNDLSEDILISTFLSKKLGFSINESAYYDEQLKESVQEIARARLNPSERFQLALKAWLSS